MIERDLNLVDPVLKRKVLAVLNDVNTKLPPEWVLEVFETLRSVERQIDLIKQGVSQIKNPKTAPHVKKIAVDVVFKFRGKWNWDGPRGGWDLVDSSAVAHGLRRIGRKFGNTFEDKPHLELKRGSK